MLRMVMTRLQQWTKMSGGTETAALTAASAQFGQLNVETSAQIANDFTVQWVELLSVKAGCIRMAGSRSAVPMRRQRSSMA